MPVVHLKADCPDEFQLTVTTVARPAFPDRPFQTGFAGLTVWGTKGKDAPHE
jgi:hypothetical protein